MTSLMGRRECLRWLRSLVAVPLLAACGPDARDSLSGLEGEEAFHRLEEGLLARQEMEIHYHITSKGLFVAELEGAMRLERDQGAFLDGEGVFGDDPVALHLEVSAGWMKGGNQDEGFEGPAPTGLREAMVVGLTRMGLLHNLARLVAGAPPDRADGTVREWVEVREVGWVAPGEGEPGTRGIRFDIWVAGQPAGEATLWLDERDLPVLREQVVRFPGGEMRVVERYEVE
jgi:hypothetical protein